MPHMPRNERLAAVERVVKARASKRRARAGRAAAAALLFALAGCATAPVIGPSVSAVPVAPAPPDAAALLQWHLAAERALPGPPLEAVASVRLLRDGPSAFRAIFAAIAGARRRIDLEYFIFQDVESDGVRLGDLLVEKRRQGVAVDLIYDGIGSLTAGRAFLARLRAAGVAMVAYNPLDPLRSKVPWSPNHRDHRKILVVDGETAIVGGVNLAKAYESDPLARGRRLSGARREQLRDADLVFSGPPAARLEDLFFQTWRAQRGPVQAVPPSVDAPAADPSASPALPAMRIIDSKPGRLTPSYYLTLISAIHRAQRSITIATAFFVPTRDEVAALAEAARRGVDVRLLAPGHSNSAMSVAVGRSHYGVLLAAGVRIYEYQRGELHSKTVAVDGVWSAIGSSNLDHRSVVYNDEVDAVILDPDVAAGLEAVFDDDRKAARRIDLPAWRRRGAGERIKEFLGRFGQALL